MKLSRKHHSNTYFLYLLSLILTYFTYFFVGVEARLFVNFFPLFFLSGGDAAVFVQNPSIVPVRFAALVFNCLMVLTRH